MYVCVRTSDEALVGSQSHEPSPGAMEHQAALDYGGQAADYTVRVVDDAAHAALVAARDAQAPGHLERLARERRDALLAACDWTQLPDAPVDKAAWAEYREALRGVPQQPGFPGGIVWPVAPCA